MRKQNRLAPLLLDGPAPATVFFSNQRIGQMLVLSRYEGQEILIGDGIRVVIVSVQKSKSGHKVRLGIDAPPNIKVNRKEVHERIQNELHEKPE